MATNSKPAKESTKYTSTEKWTLLSTILASSLVFIDSTALNIALPAIQTDLNITGPQLLWVVDAYLVFLSSLMLLGGSLGDHFGRNKIFSIGLILFSVSSLSCGLSVSPTQLIISRAFQGVGGALLTPGSLSIITSQFSEKKVGGAIGLWSTFSALTSVIGPLLGGWLSSIGLWRGIFFMNVPLALISLWAIQKKVPQSKDEEAKKLDLTGAFFITLGLAGLAFGFIESSNIGFDHYLIISSLAIGVISLITFIVVEMKKTNPMVPLSFFQVRNFSTTNTITLFIYGSLSATTFFLPLNLVQVQGYTEMQAGLAFFPTILLISLLSPITGNLVDRYGARVFLSAGPVITASGFFLFAQPGLTAGPAAYWYTFFIPALVLGIGMGITVAPLTTTVMRSLSKKNSGKASGVNNAISRIAGVLAIALLGAYALFIFKNHLQESLTTIVIPEETKQQLMKNASDFAATKVPDSVDIPTSVFLNQTIKDSFVMAFNRVAYVSSVFCLLSAALAFIFVEKIRRR
jgi:EmrB/QacA subfamily drug resistance transporter